MVRGGKAGGRTAGAQGPWAAQATDPQRKPDSPDAAEDPEEEDPALRMARLEAVLLLAREPLPTRKLSVYANLADGTEARTLLRRLNRRYDERGCAFRAEAVAGGYQILTRPELAPWLRRLDRAPEQVRLTPPAQETLAVIAYRQPVLRAEIEAIRGVASGEVLRQLLERDLVRIAGRSEDLGRPYLYATTRRFLQVFGLGSLDDLPQVGPPPAAAPDEIADEAGAPAGED
jgi:segregation and condensation protein B